SQNGVLKTVPKDNSPGACLPSETPPIIKPISTPDFGSSRSSRFSAAPAVSRNSNSTLERANVSRYWRPEYSPTGPFGAVPLKTLAGDSGGKQIKAKKYSPYPRAPPIPLQIC